MVEHFSGCQIEHCSLVAAPHCRLELFSSSSGDVLCVCGWWPVDIIQGGVLRERGETVASAGAVATGESESEEGGGLAGRLAQCRGRKVESAAATTAGTTHTHCREMLEFVGGSIAAVDQLTCVSRIKHDTAHQKTQQQQQQHTQGAKTFAFGEAAVAGKTRFLEVLLL